ncbi:hypothetical protein S40285_10732 [Stachybotrys chlorohalonatus IBT 40285]|uniref:Uncharacterized protein n=1 Tax=Stachybotrys chlorohalonatus (strain IBT 40285) TaxID=1283841 RepID=A0A084QGS0_STAC4|nr:hypothetical protein S40285_10732 [Stachybotrys chlorohalonata IBT 40285]
MDAAAHYAGLVARQYRYRYRGGRGRRIASGGIAGIVIGCIIFAVLCILLLWFCCFRKRLARRNANHPRPAPSAGLLGRFRGNRQPQPSYPGMQEAGYGGMPPHQPGPGYPPQQTGYAYPPPPQPPQPTYR